jgi:hypothetical protein
MEIGDMPAATKHPTSISALLDAPAPGTAIFRAKATAAPWDDSASAPAAESQLLTIAAAAEVVPLSVKQLYRVAERADSPFRKVESRWMVYAADLHRWIRKHATGAELSTSPDAGDTLADRVRRRRNGGAS